MSVNSEICVRGPMVGSPQLPLKGIGLSGELAETWPNLLPLSPGPVASYGVTARPIVGAALLPSRIKASMIQSCYAPNFDAF